MKNSSGPALGMLAMALFAGCFKDGGTVEGGGSRAVPLHALSFIYMEATIAVDASGSSITLAPSYDWQFKPELLPMVKRLSSEDPPPPRWVIRPTVMRFSLSLDTMKVGDGLHPGPNLPGMSLQPAATRVFRIGTFGGSPKVDSIDWAEFGLFDRKAASPFALFYVDRAATMIVDTVACGGSVHEVVHFPAPGYYALTSGSDPRKPGLAVLDPSDDLAYYSAAMDFIRSRRMSALSRCRDFQAQKDAVLGRWKRVGPAGVGTDIHHLDFRADDSLIQLDEDMAGTRRIHRLRFFADTAEIFTDDAGNGFEYSLNGSKDTLRVGPSRVVFIRDAGPDPLPDWLGRFKMAWKVPLGFYPSLGRLNSDGIAGGAGSVWVKTRLGGEARILRYDSAGRLQDTLVRIVAPGFSEAGYGLAMEGDSILWIPGAYGALRIKIPGKEELPVFNPGPEPYGLLTGKSIVGFDLGRLWTVDSYSNLLGWSTDSTDIDTLPKPPSNYGRRITVAGGHLLRAEGDKVFIRKLDASAYIATLQTEEWGEFIDIAVAGNDFWAVWRDYGDNQSYYLAKFIVLGKEPGTQDALLPP